MMDHGVGCPEICINSIHEFLPDETRVMDAGKMFEQ